jgi:two-component system heavy metal sensor histidine kinase CusS
MDGGKLDQRLSLIGLPAELHELGLHFNSMLGRLEKTWSDLRHYADTIAHEMRTPLNRMRLDCEIALDKANTVDEFRGVMAASVAECERLTKLLQGLLFLARVESKQASIANSRIPLGAHLAAIHDFFEAEAADKGLKLTFAAQLGLTVDGDPQLLQQAVCNLVSNAIAHTPSGGQITLTGERRGTDAVITVTDTGEGIACEDQPRIFDRFYRAGCDASLNKCGENLGLGLSITKGIVELHGGHIALQSQLGRGTTVEIVLQDSSAS